MIADNVIEVGYFNLTNGSGLFLERQQQLNNLNNFFSSMSINLPQMRMFDSQDKYSHLHSFLIKSIQKEWSDLYEIIQEVNEFQLKNSMTSKDLNYLAELNIQIENWLVPKLIILELPEKIPVAENIFLHGFCYRTIGEFICIIGFKYPYPELFYHEICHFLGAQDGYDEINNFKTIPGCEECWMQYEPAKGKTLCDKHLKEIKECLDRYEKKLLLK
ncbi:MAG: hypothetical protein IPL26_13650 [Leptospiraceae bacterium]|nr:hypothetical protein [Leptospiraceae bacterium]